jgi:hypothetical protein
VAALVALGAAGAACANLARRAALSWEPAPRGSPAAFIANSLFFQKQIQIELLLAA